MRRKIIEKSMWLSADLQQVILVSRYGKAGFGVRNLLALLQICR